VLDATGLAAVVRDGYLVALRGGDCLVTVRLTLDGERLAERQGNVDPGLVLRLHHPVRLAGPAADTSVTSV
jgi:hypothetical protein